MKGFVKTVELLAPAKDYLSAVAAVDYGADAVYIGGPKFGARYAAGNSAAEIARVVEYAHRFCVRVHATLNTLLWDEELAEAEAQARELIAAGVDALIVQDMALRRMNLPVELHASTQVCNRTPEGARFLGEAGFARVILERALSLDEIRAICAATTAEVECFVHGAICVGYSGRCFLSRSMSDRSTDRASRPDNRPDRASRPDNSPDRPDNRPDRPDHADNRASRIADRSGNRGACSQPCRLTYDLTDGRGHTYMAGKHLLSVRDLDLSQRLGELMDAGVASFKIEGRLKDIAYIRNVVAHYRRAVDEALALRPHLRRASVGESVPDFTPDPSKSFTRGASAYFLDGKRPGVASFDTPKSVGEYLGRVVHADHRSFRLDRPADAAPGDGICFVAKRGPAGAQGAPRGAAQSAPQGAAQGSSQSAAQSAPQGSSQGASQNALQSSPQSAAQGAGGTNINAVENGRIVPDRMAGIAPGVDIFRNFDRRFNRLVERSRTRRTIPVQAVAEASEDGFRLTCTDCTGMQASAERLLPLERAKTPEANAAAIRAQAAKSGDTIFAVRDVEVLCPEWFVPASLAAEMRRECLEKLLQARSARPPERRILPDNPAAKYPADRLAAEDNVTNRLAEAFYRDHGVREIEPPLERAASTVGHRVMRSSYCLRRELGECLLENPRLRGELYLERGAHRYRLEFDCAHCEMNLIDSSKPNPTETTEPNRK